MDEHDVVVEDVAVEYQNTELNQDSKKEANFTWFLGFLIIGVEFPCVTVRLHECSIDHRNKDEVHYVEQAIPSNELAKEDWEAVNVLIWQVTNCSEEHENYWIT